MESGFYKYVRLEDNSFVFGEALTSQHFLLVPDDKIAISAGFLYLFSSYFYIDGNAESLDLSPLPDDEDYLEKILEVPWKK